MSNRRGLDAAIMRGGTSRGVVLPLDCAPAPGPDRDELARAVIGSSPVQGLGGGTPVTSKVVLVGPGPSAMAPTGGSSGADLNYIVGNVSSDGCTVDWSGTCGNMTAAVLPYAFQSGLIDRVPDQFPYRLRNLATQGTVEVTVAASDASLSDEAEEISLTTAYLDPGGAVLGQTLPTGHARDLIEFGGEEFDFSLVDVTHPYLFLRYEQVIGSGRLSDPATHERIEAIRGRVCVRLGLCDEPDEARSSLAAVPRVVLVHDASTDENAIDIRAISMGQPIGSVPVTAALSLAAASSIEDTIVTDQTGSRSAEVLIRAESGVLRAQAVVDEDGEVRRASVQRTARTLMRGRLWV